MIYGLYLSASGIVASTYRQDVLSNNLANSETVGFKRDLALFRERPTAMQERHQAGDWSDPVMEGLGGGILAQATMVDRSQGDIETTSNPLDVAINGAGFLAVKANGEIRLTRDGRMMTNREGELVMNSNGNHHVLDVNRQPIHLEPGSTNVQISQDGTITQDKKVVAQLGLFDVPDQTKLKQLGGGLQSYPDTAQIRPGTGIIASNFVERANVDPTTELTELMETQRQLEANANMIHYQDETLARLVNDVGKIG